MAINRNISGSGVTQPSTGRHVEPKAPAAFLCADAAGYIAAADMAPDGGIQMQ